MYIMQLNGTDKKKMQAVLRQNSKYSHLCIHIYYY